MTTISPRERTAAIMTLREVRGKGMGRLLRTRLVPVGVPEGWEGPREMCVEHAFDCGLVTPSRLAAHLVEEHSDEAERCDCCDVGYAVEVRHADVIITGGPLVGQRLGNGEPVFIGGRFRFAPFARICDACADLWPRDTVDTVEIR